MEAGSIPALATIPGGKREKQSCFFDGIGLKGFSIRREFYTTGQSAGSGRRATGKQGKATYRNSHITEVGFYYSTMLCKVHTETPLRPGFNSPVSRKHKNIISHEKDKRRIALHEPRGTRRLHNGITVLLPCLPEIHRTKGLKP